MKRQIFFISLSLIAKITLSQQGPGYGAKPRFEFHKLSNTYNTKQNSKMTIPKWLDGKKLPHWHRGKGDNLKYHRPWEVAPNGKRKW